MDFSKGMDILSNLCKGKDWFYDVGMDPYGRYVVYVNYMCHETLHNIPDTVEGKQVLVHFAASKTATREQFVDQPAGSKTFVPQVFDMQHFLQKAREAQANGIDTGLLSTMDEETHAVLEDLSMRHLEDELDRLEKLCGSNSLQDIFYEIQDGKNAVTNLSARYPDVRTRLEKLYDQYGFDVIYENLDG